MILTRLIQHLSSARPPKWAVSARGRGPSGRPGHARAPAAVCESCCPRPLNMQLLGCGVEGNGNMTTWAPSKRARNERVEAEADALIRDLGDQAYHEARRREHEARSDSIAEAWALVAKAIARKTGSPVRLNLSTQLAMHASS